MVCCDLPAFSDLLGPCTNDVFTAYAHVRTEPKCDIGHTRGKKRANCYHNVVFDKGSMSVVETQRLRGRMQFMDGQMLADLEDAFASKD